MRSLGFFQQIAEQNGWKLNPDLKVVENIIKAENNLHQKFGEYYCPCRLQKIPDNICPCRHAQQEIEKDGKCHCQLFFNP